MQLFPLDWLLLEANGEVGAALVRPRFVIALCVSVFVAVVAELVVLAIVPASSLSISLLGSRLTAGAVSQASCTTRPPATTAPIRGTPNRYTRW